MPVDWSSQSLFIPAIAKLNSTAGFALGRSEHSLVGPGMCLGFWLMDHFPWAMAFLSEDLETLSFYVQDSVADLYFYKQVVIYVTASGLALPSPPGD